MKRFVFGLAILAMLLGGVGQATAGTISVLNPSFESPTTPFYNGLPPTGWVFLGGGAGGVFRPNNTFNGGNGNYVDPAKWPNGAPDGIQVAYVVGTLAQGTPTAALAGVSYTLDVYVGFQNNIGGASLYNVSLLEGTTLIASSSGTAPFNEYQLVSVTGTAKGLGDLTIELSGVFNPLTGNSQTLFDDVQLSSVPEPSTLVMSSIMFGMLGVVWTCKRMKRTAMAA
jgi:hypothetical protein